MLEIAASGTLLVALAFLLPNSRIRTTKPLKELRRCDWVGMGLFFISSITILIPVNIGGTVQPWNSAVVITCLVVGCLSLSVLIYHQRYLANNPAFPRQVFTKPVTNVAFFGSLVSGMLLSMIFYNLVLFWEGVRHLPTMEIGVMLLAVTLPYTICAALTGIAIRLWGHIKWATIAGTAFAELGLGLMYFLTEEGPVGPLVVITMLAAIGCGIYLPAMINTILASTDRQWHSHAIAMRTQLYTAGQCMGISIGLAIFTNKFKYQVQSDRNNVAITPQELMRMIKHLEPGSEAIGLIVVALRWVWGAAGVIGFIAGLPACILKCPALPQDSGRAGGEGDLELESRAVTPDNGGEPDQGNKSEQTRRQSYSRLPLGGSSSSTSEGPTASPRSDAHAPLAASEIGRRPSTPSQSNTALDVPMTDADDASRLSGATLEPRSVRSRDSSSRLHSSTSSGADSHPNRSLSSNPSAVPEHILTMDGASDVISSSVS